MSPNPSLRKFPWVFAAIVCLAGCSENHPDNKPTTPPRWTEEEIANFDHLLASEKLLEKLTEFHPVPFPGTPDTPGTPGVPGETQSVTAVARQALTEAELVHPEHLAKAHADLPRVFEQWYLPMLRALAATNRGRDAYDVYAADQWRAWWTDHSKEILSRIDREFPEKPHDHN